MSTEAERKHPIMQSGAVVALHFMNEYIILIGFTTFLCLSWLLQSFSFCVERCGQLFCLIEGSSGQDTAGEV